MEKDNELQEIQRAIASSGLNWQATHTAFTSLSHEDKTRLLGYTPGPNDPSLEEQEKSGEAKLAEYRSGNFARGFAAPAAIDWRNNGGNFVTPVKNQGGCGSCVAFGTVAAVESLIKIQRGAAYAVDLSEAQLFYCIARSQSRNCGNGWWPENALIGFRDIGVTDEACYPYTAGDQNCTGRCTDWASRVTKITGYKKLNTIAEIKEYVATTGPVEACFTVYNDFYSYTSGVYKHVTGGVVGGHCVCIVGYSDALGAWICKNSWGTGFGMSGYFNIAYGQCGIEGQVYAVTGVENNYWINGKKIIGLWANNSDKNAWIYITDFGWRRLSPNNEDGFINMLNQSSTAKLAGSTVNVQIANGVVETLYVF